MTKQKQVEKSAINIVEQNAFIFDRISDGFFALDETLTIVFFNKSAERLLGINRSDVLGRLFFEVFSEAQDTVFEEKLKHSINYRQPIEFSSSFGTGWYKNWYQFSMSAEQGFSFIYFHVTRRHQWAEEALRRSEQFNKALLMAIPQLVLSLSETGKILDVSVPPDNNPGIPPGITEGRLLSDVFPLDVAKLFQQHITACIRAGQEQEFDYSLPLATDMRTFHVRMVSNGKQSVLAVAQDVTANIEVAQEFDSVLNAEREQRLIAETLAEVTLALTSQTNLKAVLDEVLRQTQRLVPYRTAHIMLLKDDHLHIAGWQGYRQLGSEELVSKLVQPLAEFPIDAEVIRSRQPLVITDTHQESRWVVQEQTAWVRSHVVVPISLGERVLGILRLDANTTNAYSKQDVVRLQPLTNAAAIALENARLYDQAQLELAERIQVEHEIRRRNRELALLNQVIAASATSVEIDEILQTTCQSVAQTFDLPIVSATMFSDNNSQAKLVARYPRKHLPPSTKFSTEADPIVQYLLKNKTSLVISDVAEDPRLTGVPSGIFFEGVKSILVLPLVVENRVLGSLNLQATDYHQFSDQEINLAWRVTDQVAGVLARAQWERQHRRLSEAIEQSAESVVITDINGILVYVNPSFERITGYSSEEVLGKKLTMLRSGKQDEEFYGNLWKTISSGRVWHGRFVNKRKDGTLYTDEATISPVRSENGTIVSYVGVQRDVTRELQLEEQYRQAQKMEAVGLLAGGVAHDFNNLLTVINGFAEMIQFELPPDNLHLQKLASRVRYSGTRAAALVRQLLAFSRKEFVEPKVLNLNKVVTDISKMLERLIEENIVLRTEFAPDLWPVKVDAHQIEQIIVNLTVNARDAMPDGGLLSIETENKLVDDDYTASHLGVETGEYVLLTVSDTGIGMDDDVKQHLFEPFFTTKERGKGTGLGLATVFGIVKQYEGAIFVYSEPQKGATFKIYFPRANEYGEDAAATGRVDGIPRGSELVLVVEDESTVRDLAVYMLRRQGYQVLEASNGEEALRVAQKTSEKIELLLTDTVMPKMSGKVLAEEFRLLYPETKILFTSGYTDKNIMQHSMMEPGMDFIPKPFSAAELARKVRIVLDS
jgi:PAS domain S-box-containing protein